MLLGWNATIAGQEKDEEWFSAECSIEQLQYSTVAGKRKEESGEEGDSACLLLVSRLFDRTARVSICSRFEAACIWSNRKIETGRRGAWLNSLMVIDPGVRRWINRKEGGRKRLGGRLSCPLLQSLFPSCMIQWVEQKGRDIGSGERETGCGWELSFSGDYLPICLTTSQLVGKENGGVEG